MMTYKIYVEDPSYIPTVVASVGSSPGLEDVVDFSSPPSGDEAYIAIISASESIYTTPVWLADETPTNLPANPYFVITQPLGGVITVFRPASEVDASYAGFFIRAQFLDSEEIFIMKNIPLYFSYNYNL